MSEQKKIWLKKTGVLLFWLVIWQLLSMAIGNTIIFVGPKAMLSSLTEQMAKGDFWLTIASSFGKISAGFLAAFFASLIAGILSWRYSLLKDLLEPAIHLMKAIPVASFVVMALIWAGSENLSIVISFLVVFPVIYENVLMGLFKVDKNMVEMAQVFHMSPLKKCLYIYRPSLMPYLVSACKAALGMSWKSGVAAEIIGVPAHSIGERLYMSKIYLNTDSLFAWTLVIIIVSMIFEWIFMWCLKKAGGKCMER